MACKCNCQQDAKAAQIVRETLRLQQEIAALRHHLSLYEEALEDIEEEGDAKAAQIVRETLYLAGIDPVKTDRDFTPADTVENYEDAA